MAGFLYIYREADSFASAPRLVVVSPENNFATDRNSIIVEGLTDRDASVYINNQPILVGDNGKFKENIVLQAGNNNIIIRSVNRFGKEISQDITVQANFQSVEDENKEINDIVGKDGITASRPLEIEVRVDPGPSWLSVETDGSLVFSGTMLPGSAQLFSADEKIVIDSGKGNETFVRINGKEARVLSEKNGPVRGVTFNPNQIEP